MQLALSYSLSVDLGLSLAAFEFFIYIYDRNFSISDEPFDLCSDVIVDILAYGALCVVSNSVS